MLLTVQEAGSGWLACSESLTTEKLQMRSRPRRIEPMLRGTLTAGRLHSPEPAQGADNHDYWRSRRGSVGERGVGGGAWCRCSVALGRVGVVDDSAAWSVQTLPISLSVAASDSDTMASTVPLGWTGHGQLCSRSGVHNETAGATVRDPVIHPPSPGGCRAR